MAISRSDTDPEDRFGGVEPPPDSGIEQARATLEKAREFINQGAAAKGEDLLKQLVRTQPDYFGAWFLLGTRLFQRGDMWGAVACFNRASMLNPANVAALTNLGLAYFRLGALDWSGHVLRLALRRDPDNPKLCRMLAEVFQSRGDLIKAAEQLERVRTLDPASFETLQDLGAVHFECGRMQDAARCWLDALALEKAANPASPRLADIYQGLAMVPADLGGLDLPAEIGALEDAQGDWPDTARLKLQFAKSRALDRAGEFPAAWRELERANKQVWEDVKEDARREFERVKGSLRDAEAFDARGLAPVSVTNRTFPVFIAGASRSGKTTFERLLAALPGVRTGYEANIVQSAVARAAMEAGLPKLRNLRELPEELDGKFGESFLLELSAHARGARFYTITHPRTVRDAGRLASAIPNSVFVFVKRDAGDQLLRCYQTQYANRNFYSYNRAACRDYLKAYGRLSDVWAEKLAPRSIVLTYEEMVADPNAVLERLARLVPLEIPTGATFETGDDRGCAKPYAKLMKRRK